MFSLIIFSDAPIHGIFFQNPKDLALSGWLQSIIAMGGRDDSVQHGENVHYNGRDWYDDDDDNNLVYIKVYEKREWLQNLLQDDAREGVYIENIDEHYEDMESVNKLDITHTLRCQKHVTNNALQNVFKLFNWHQRHQK